MWLHFAALASLIAAVLQPALFAYPAAALSGASAQAEWFNDFNAGVIPDDLHLGQRRFGGEGAGAVERTCPLLPIAVARGGLLGRTVQAGLEPGAAFAPQVTCISEPPTGWLQVQKSSQGLWIPVCIPLAPVLTPQLSMFSAVCQPSSL